MQTGSNVRAFVPNGDDDRYLWRALCQNTRGRFEPWKYTALVYCADN